MREISLDYFPIDYSIVNRILSFLRSGVTRKLAARRRIFIEAITKFYSIEKACGVHGDNPIQVVTHLRRFLPKNIFTEDDIDYYYYPEMVLAVSRQYSEFEPSRKLLTMAYIVRILSKNFVSISHRSRQVPLYWFRSINDFHIFLYDLKVGFERIRVSQRRVSVPEFSVIIVLDSERVFDSLLDRLKEFSDFIVFLIVSDKGIRIYKPEGLGIDDLIAELSDIMDVTVEEYSPNSEKLDEMTRYLKEVIFKSDIWPWHIGFFVSRLIKNRPDFIQLASRLKLEIDYSSPIYSEPQFLPLLSAVYLAIKRIAENISTIERMKASIIREQKKLEDLTVGRIVPVSQPEEPIRPIVPVQRFAKKPRVSQEAEYRATDIGRYIAYRLIKYATGAPIYAEDITYTKNIVRFKIALQELHGIQVDDLHVAELLDKNGNCSLYIYYIGSLEDFYFAFMEAKYLQERTKCGHWLLMDKTTAVLKTPWKSSLILVIAKDIDELETIIQKILGNTQEPLSSQIKMQVYFEDCDTYISDALVDLREALILIETHPWECSENFIGFENKGEIIQFIRFSEDSWLIDVPKKEGETLEIYQDSTLDTEHIRKIVRAFFNGDDWRKYCNLRKVEKINLRDTQRLQSSQIDSLKHIESLTNKDPQQNKTAEPQETDPW